MFILKKKIILIFFLLGLLVSFNNFSIIVKAAECDDKQNQEKVTCLESKVKDLESQGKTLSSQISIMDSQIRLTEARIEANKREILNLILDIDIATRKISSLQDSLNKITEVLLNRIVATYQAGRVQPLEMLLSSRDASSLLARLNYLRIAQAHDKKLIYDVQQAKNDYTNQKDILEAKKKKIEALKTQLEQYTKQLEQDKAGKQELLRVTKNDEEKYQRLLAQAQAERAIVLGGGKEIFLRNVNVGDSIATIISGTSGCSTGTHLHFSIYQGTSVRDPNDYFLSKSFSYSYDSSLYNYYGTINPRGSYPWPLEDPITINQGYGPHGYASRYHGGIHDGIDMDGGNLNVKAVRSGKLYQGSYGGCSYGPLNFVKIEHDDGLITWYLHVVAN